MIFVALLTMMCLWKKFKQFSSTIKLMILWGNFLTSSYQIWFTFVLTYNMLITINCILLICCDVDGLLLRLVRLVWLIRLWLACSFVKFYNIDILYVFFANKLLAATIVLQLFLKFEFSRHVVLILYLIIPLK